MNVVFRRSAKWLKEQRLARAENVDQDWAVDVDVADLCEGARRLLLEYGGGQYPTELDAIWFSESFQPREHGNYGRVFLAVDADEPDADAISQAVVDAFVEVSRKREEAVQQQQEQARQKQEAKAKRAEAEKVLARELTELQERREDITTLSDLLARVPLDALRGAAKRLAEEMQGCSAEEIENRVDDAADCYVFRYRGRVAKQIRKRPAAAQEPPRGYLKPTPDHR